MILFIPWILVMGERENFLNQFQYYNANAMLNFLSDANTKNHLSMSNFDMSFSSTSINSKLDFLCFWKGKNKNLKENLWFTFQEELWWMRKENQIINNKTMTTQTKLSTKVKTKTNQGVPQCKWKMSFWTHKQTRNTKHSTLNQPLVLSQLNTLNSWN